ncbi:MAG: hypothetical protein RLZZ175_802 [Bacteroidota bacterium]|jgi:tetratricopeptide (TPR) repeat protein
MFKETKYRLLFFLVFVTNVLNAQDSKPFEPMFGDSTLYNKHLLLENDIVSRAYKFYGDSAVASNKLIFKALDKLKHDSLDAAMRIFNCSWLLNVNNPTVYLGFAYVLDSRKLYQTANKYYHLAILKDTSKQHLITYLQTFASIKENANDVFGASRIYEKMLLVNPNLVFPIKKLGYLNMKMKQNAKAIFFYSKAISLDTLDVTSYSYRGQNLMMVGNAEKAIKDFDKALSIDKNHISSLENRGLYYFSIKQYEKAKIDFEKIASIDAEDIENLILLGKSQYELNQKKLSKKIFKKASKLGSSEAKELLKKLQF